MVRDFADAAVRADSAGFEVAEVHAAHGYLLHNFLSPLTNERADEYGGDLEGRSRALREVVQAVRAVWPERKPLFVRVSATDFADGGWDVPETVELAAHARDAGRGPARRVRRRQRAAAAHRGRPGLPGAVRPRRARGLRAADRRRRDDHPAAQAEQVLVDGSADAVLLARALLRDPHWALAAAAELGAEVDWPVQYVRARR